MYENSHRTYFSYRTPPLGTGGACFFVYYFLCLDRLRGGVCVTNPEQGLCDIFVTVTPSAYTVSPGGNTNVAFDVSGILQYDLVVIELDEWMIEDGTGAYTNLSDGYWAPYGGTEVINTGALTRSVMVSSFVMNSQGMTDSDSSYITVSSPPSVQLYFQ